MLVSLFSLSLYYLVELRASGPSGVGRLTEIGVEAVFGAGAYVVAGFGAFFGAVFFFNFFGKGLCLGSGDGQCGDDSRCDESFHCAVCFW
jgi:hypothetical protein